MPHFPTKLSQNKGKRAGKREVLKGDQEWARDLIGTSHVILTGSAATFFLCINCFMGNVRIILL